MPWLLLILVPPVVLIGGGILAVKLLWKPRERMAEIRGTSNRSMTIEGPKDGPYTITIEDTETGAVLHEEPWPGEIQEGFSHGQQIMGDY